MTFILSVLDSTVDLLKVCAIVIILHRIFVCKNASGISLRTQYWLLLSYSLSYVISCFYLWNRDYTETGFSWTFEDSYFTILSFFYLSATFLMAYSMNRVERIKSSYQAEGDATPSPRAMMTAAGLSVLFVFLNLIFGEAKLLWWPEKIRLCSPYFEAMALLPQLFMYRKCAQAESLTGGVFLLLMGLKGLLSVIYVLISWKQEPKTQTILYCAYIPMIGYALEAGIGITGALYPGAPALPILATLGRDSWMALSLFIISLLILWTGAMVGGEKTIVPCLVASLLCILPWVGFFSLMWSPSDGSSPSRQHSSATERSDMTTGGSYVLHRPTDPIEETAADTMAGSNSREMVAPSSSLELVA